jgi:RNA polymerase sigma-70 factor, ECF subfamily
LALAITETVQAGSRRENDADLLAMSANGNRAAFSTLVEQLYPLVYRVVWRMTSGHVDTDDIVQEAIVRLWKHIGELREPAALKAWVIKVASNLARDRYRGPASGVVDEVAEIADVRPLADATAMTNWAQKKIDVAIHALPERQRLALTLIHFEQLPQALAADVMGVTLDAFESLLARARRALKEQLAADKSELLSAVQMEGR